ncbi:hypothetical protein ABL78_6924 [Leptomonas seymouri]|uniref:Uncharacterized protein n=1 Tax=Leptomonas seymouri TaxID=5684 RepID=A0A0N0P3E2_LEPSE|nr:hypothetical protein ABL78_6924 [Leptomonas seymouri]|eukprot:KPI84026.1 hypothetical protein ABL78_6924 [Leptomonas seymouri]
MDKLSSISDSELVAWASSFSGAADSHLYHTRDHTDHRQHSQGLSSQSISYQPSQLTFLSSADDRPSASPHLLSNSMEKESSQQYRIMPTPPTLSPAQPPQQQALVTRTHQYTVPSISTFAGLTDQQPQKRNAEGTLSMKTAAPSVTHSHINNDEVQSRRHSASFSVKLPRRSRNTAVATAATVPVILPMCASHRPGTGDVDMGGDMEVKGEHLENYLDLQDEDGDSDDADVGCTEGHAAYPAQQTSDLPRSCSQHSPPSRANGRNSLWMSGLCDMTGDASIYNNNSNSNDNNSAKHAYGKPLSHSPCTPIEVDMLNAGNLDSNAPCGAGSADAATMPIIPCAGPAKKAQPPPLSGFTPVAATVSSLAPRTSKANNVNASTDNYHTANATSSLENNNDVRSNRSTTPQLLSLDSSSKASPPYLHGPGGLVEEERRLKEEWKTLCQRLFDTEQKLARVQRRIAESSFNSTAAAGTVGLEAQRSMQQQPPLQITNKVTPAESRLLDAAASSTAAGAGAAPPPGVYMVSSSTAQHYAIGASPMERRAPPTQQQHMASSSTNSRVYMSSAPSPSSATMPHQALSDASGPSSSGMTYFVQSNNPFGVYATPSTGTQVDATGSPIQTTGACTTTITTTTTTNTSAAMFSASPQPGGSTVQVLGSQPYMVNNQHAICYMVLTPQAQQQQPSPLPPPRQQQQLTASGPYSTALPPPEFGSINNSNNSGASGSPHMKGASPTHMSVLTTTSLTSSAAATKAPEVPSSYPHIVMVGPASNGELTRKCFNVHGSMVGVVPYFPYDESALPAPTATILTAVTPSSASALGQPISGAGWSMRSINGGGADVALGNSCRSHDGLSTNDYGAIPPHSCGSSSPPHHAKSPPTTHSDLSTAPVLPIFIQMFPCELHDRVTVLNRVIEATCGRDFGVAQRIEPRSETSFIAHVRTHQVWQLIYKLRCRVLMDRFGLWYAADLDQYIRMKEYCEGVRRLPQQTRHFQTDGLPCMPLVVELSRVVDKAVVTENNAPRTFDEIVPMVAVDRHRTRPNSSAAASGPSGPTMSNINSRGGSVVGFAPTTMSTSGVLTETNAANGGNTTSGANKSSATSMLNSAASHQWSMMAAPANEVGFLTGGNSIGGSGTRAGQPAYTDARPPPHPFI